MEAENGCNGFAIVRFFDGERWGISQSPRLHRNDGECCGSIKMAVCGIVSCSMETACIWKGDAAQVVRGQCVTESNAAPLQKMRACRMVATTTDSGQGLEGIAALPSQADHLRSVARLPNFRRAGPLKLIPSYGATPDRRHKGFQHDVVHQLPI